MKEEEVDRYFKEKFQQFAPVPSADAWARLQSKMESPQQKRSHMWVYYAAAAVTLVLVSGALLFWFQTDKLSSGGNLARIKRASAQKFTPKAPKETLLADINTQTPALPETVEPAPQEKEIKNNNNASTSTTKPIKKGKKIRPGILVAATNRIKPQEISKFEAEKKSTHETQVTTVAAENLPDSSPITEDRVMEVIIKKDPEATIAFTNDKDHSSSTEEVIKENISKKGRLVKNIFKQVRNLKNGEKVELSEFGLNANYRIDVESKIFKHKYTKVINL
ncbi:MAG: hypothetical protein M3Q05_11625 [Bacteroidota bacterium]|nr:hypothetical protein [Bacteroidota bacterium]